MQLHIDTKLSYQSSSPDNWLPGYPNPADFRFDYYKLLNNAPTGIARLPNEVRSVAVIGAGAAGMTAARELLRCGFVVTIFEASDRIGGRLYTEENPAQGAETDMEMGAMRMPFFPAPGSENCILEYYMMTEPGSHAIKPVQFPNPGSAHGSTGIYLNRGHGPNNQYETPKLIKWPYNGKPDNAEIDALSVKAVAFIRLFENNTKDLYTAAGVGWETLWGEIVNFYGDTTFDDLVMLQAITSVDPTDPGNFGGFGMTPEEAILLYTIGTGDGSWGAFYSISALWFIRCTMFGFGGSELQTISGYTNPETMPFYGSQTYDSCGQPLPVPRYRGIQSLVEYLFYVKAPNAEYSLYESPDASLHINSEVTNITREQSGAITVTYGNDSTSASFDYVFISSAQWASQMSFQMDGFSEEQLPQDKITTEHTQHNISSCKLFFPLTETYWTKPDNKIPQVIVTDTFVQDAYALSWGTNSNDKGVMLASYTWEDDSLKLLPFNQDELVEKVTNKLRQITLETRGQDVTQYFVTDQPVMIQWINEKGYDGCAKLYRQRDETANMIDLSYNQNFGKLSNLYFVGENYSVEGGWTEPALRSALDGVMQLLNNVGATFAVTDFDFATDYPKWSE